MKRKIVIMAVSVASLAAVSVLSASLGYKLGVVVGNGEGAALSGINDAAATLAVLRCMRDGHTHKALSLLESRLDGHIFALGHVGQITPDWITRSRKLLSSIRDYRRAYPRDWAGVEHGGYEVNIRNLGHVRNEVERILGGGDGNHAGATEVTGGGSSQD